MSTFARTPDGDLQIPRVLLTNPAEVALQTLIDILSLWQGTWFLNLLSGTPWLSILGAKNLSVAYAKYVLRQAILSAPYVVSVNVDVWIDSGTRSLAYTFAAKLNTGEVLTGGTAQAFQIQPQPGAQN